MFPQLKTDNFQQKNTTLRLFFFRKILDLDNATLLETLLKYKQDTKKRHVPIDLLK